MVFGIGGRRRRMAGDRADQIRESITIGSAPYAAPSADELGRFSSPPGPTFSVSGDPDTGSYRAQSVAGNIDLGGAASTAGAVADAMDLAALKANAQQFMRTHGGRLTKGAGLIGGAGALLAAGEALNDPTGTQLGNVSGAAGAGLGGLAGVLTGARIGGMVGGAPGAIVGGLIAPMIGSGLGEGIGRTVAGAFEDPTRKAIQEARQQRELQREEGLKDLQARLPVELEAAALKGALQQKLAAQQAEIDGRNLMRQGLVQGMLERTRGQSQQDLALTAGIMNSIYG